MWAGGPVSADTPLNDGAAVAPVPSAVGGPVSVDTPLDDGAAVAPVPSAAVVNPIVESSPSTKNNALQQPTIVNPIMTAEPQPGIGTGHVPAPVEGMGGGLHFVDPCSDPYPCHGFG